MTKGCGLPSNKPTAPLFLLVPVILLYSLLIGGGLLKLITESSGFIPALGLHEVSLSHYLKILGDPTFLASLGYSLYLAFVSASLSTFLGLLIAYKMVFSKKDSIKKLTRKILQVGVVLPYLLVVFLVMLMLSKAGLVSRIAYQVGLISGLDQFPNLLYDPWGGGIILTFVAKGTPFIGLFAVTVMANISDTYSQVAKTLGLSNFMILKKIILPLSSNAIVWSSAIIFAYNLGSFEVPYLLGNVKVVSLSSRLYSLYISPQIDTIPTAMAMSLTLLLVGLISVCIYGLLLNRLLKGKSR